MKCFSLLLKWTLGVCLFGLSISAHLTEADPTDDFSMSLGYPSNRVYRLISEETVGQVFSDRLDLFPKSQAKPLAKHLIALCDKYRFDPAFILSLIDVESRFQVGVVSYAGAVGLMQLMVPTASFVVRELGVFDTGYGSFKGWKPSTPISSQAMSRLLREPFANTAIGMAYLAFLRDTYEGLPPYYVLAAYNLGPARLDELLERKTFRPTETKKYFLSIIGRIHDFRFYKNSPKPRIQRRRRV